MQIIKSLFRNPQSNNEDYRADIDGLRAIAVLSVVIYHINPAILSGGFAGVDIFFVISGYLITSHLLSEIAIKHDLSLIRFYGRRVKRIIPALVVMVLTTIAFGYFYLTNFYFKNLGYESISSLLSFSNIYYYLNTGYFDIDSSMRPLLHTWSLGVEEQFYFVWPLLLITIYKISRKPIFIALGFVFLILVSYLSNYIFSNDIDALFYLMPFRVFELASGGFVAWLHLNKITVPLFELNIRYKDILSLFGLLLVFIPFVYLEHGVVFPYYNVIPTLIGCVILIYFNSTLASRLLSGKAIVYIGLLSYSFYLYHWPIIFYAKYLDLDVRELEYGVAVFALSLVSAFVSYHIVEKPFRYIKKGFINKMLFGLFVTSVIISLAISGGIAKSYNSSKELIGDSEDRLYYLRNNSCQIVTVEKSESCNWNAEKQVLFLGNSHNVDGYNMFSYLYGDNPEYNLIFGGDTNHLNCNYIYDDEENEFVSKGGKCEFGAKLLSSKKFVISIDVVVISYFRLRDWGSFHRTIIEKLSEMNPDIKVIMIGGFIGLRPARCKELINKSGNLDICKGEKYVTYWGASELDWVKNQSYYKSDNFLYIDRVALLCGEKKELNKCKTRSGRSLFFYDGDHFSLTGSRYVADRIWKYYKRELVEFGLDR